MTSIKKALYKILGLQNYLKVLHKSFHLLYSSGYLKSDIIYKYHYFDKYLIQKGDYILDIGANLGYYTTLFSKWTGPSGKVYAVEPVTVFYNTIKWATKNCNNVEVFNYALGTEEKEITMATPDNFGYLRTGLLHVVDDNNGSNYEFSFKAKMQRASVLFKDLSKLDYIKCDIEGYEDIVLPEMGNIIAKFKPIIQLETWGKHRPKIETFLLGLGYEMYDIENNILLPLQDLKHPQTGDMLFIHKDNNSIIRHLKAINHA